MNVATRSPLGLENPFEMVSLRWHAQVLHRRRQRRGGVQGSEAGVAVRGAVQRAGRCQNRPAALAGPHARTGLPARLQVTPKTRLHILSCQPLSAAARWLGCAAEQWLTLRTGAAQEAER